MTPVFFFHIPKTGGVSLLASFRTSLGARATLHIVDVRPKSLVPRLERFLRRGRVYFFQAHVSPKDVPASLPILRATAVRDPVERILAKFCGVYALRRDQQKHFDFLSRCPTYAEGYFRIEDIERWITAYENDNEQVRFLTNCYGRKPTAETLEEAKRIIDSCQVVGITENLVGLMVLLGRVARFDIRAPIWANESDRSIIREDADKVRSRLLPYFDLDLVLHEYVRRRFEALMQEHGLSLASDFPVSEKRRPALFRERVLAVLDCNALELALRCGSRLRRARNTLADVMGQFRLFRAR